MFAECFTAWAEGLRNPTAAGAGPGRAASDGKTSRRTRDRARDRKPLHPASAWSGNRHIENQPHRVLDAVRHVALGLIGGPDDKHSLEARRKSAACDTGHLEALIRQSA